MKRSFFLLPLLLALTSCAQPAVLPIARDIANIQLMRTIALDRGEHGGVKVTVSGGVRPGGDGGSPQPPVILTQESETVFGAALHIQTYGDGYVSFGHISQCILSTQAAAQPNGAAQLLDFVERDFETRISTDLYLTEEESASDLLTETASETHSAAERLDSLRRDFSLESQGWTVTVRDLMLDLADNGSGLVPVLRLEKSGDETTIVSNQMAWFREDAFQDTLTEAQSRGAAILSDKLKSGSVELTLGDGTTVGLRLTGERLRWEPIWSGERLTGLKARVHVTADLAEEQGAADFRRPEVLEEAERRLNGILTGSLREVLDLSQREKADFLHLQRITAVKCPSKHRILQENWAEWFPELELSIDMDSSIQRSYDVVNSEPDSQQP